MSKHQGLFTNKWIVQVSLRENFRKLKVECTPEYKNQTLEQFCLPKTYYLMDKVVESGWQESIEEKSIAEISAKIFTQELINLDIPEDMWPEVSNFEIFNKFIRTKLLILGADFGKSKITNKEIAY